ncbi:DUF294 nucleotidyltransferase-like domain-containing protein [Photobacterium makurazakiensis]|uniref:putative nucleotidyltransferase substrate binding domain-containing protein n=1 Tax=Photobacterium makurazakiensis TaxID=2910234 RepID=UPI003D13F06B
MSETFDTSLPPFDRLSPTQLQTLVGSLDVAYFRQGDTLIEANSPCHQLFIIIKGSVEESAAKDDGEVYAHYTADDMFDVRAMLEPQFRHRYTALEDTLCYLLPREVFNTLYQNNGQFAAYFESNLARRQQLLEEAHRQQNLAEFILTKVDDDSIQPCLTLPRNTSLRAVTEQLQDMGMDAALVEADDEHPYGIVTRTNLLHATMLDNLPPSTDVGQVATAPVISVNKGDFLFNAMLAMTRHKIKRVSVLDEGNIVGMLDLTQVLSLFSTHSHVLTLRIARANSIEELALAASSQSRLVETLFNNGIHTRFVMELIATVNEQIIEKAFQLIVPQVMHDHCCFVVMGSEGRGEQILKTDQDNALILDDGVEWPTLSQTMHALTETLNKLGYPLCPGNVMVNNPKWVKDKSEWLHTIKALISRGNETDMMELAILADSYAVAGNRELLTPIKQQLHQQMIAQERLLTTFTRPVLRFSVPLSLFGKLKASKHGLDIKQGGIFPIVHGCRALALEHNIDHNNTFERIEQLVEHKVLEPSTASNLNEALKLFIKLRLRQQLDHPSGGLQQHIKVERLNRTDRDLLRHSLHVVKKFKEWLGYHYQIRD